MIDNKQIQEDDSPMMAALKTLLRQNEEMESNLLEHYPSEHVFLAQLRNSKRLLLLTMMREQQRSD